jgi:sugar lactone lactonase YvrE
VRYTGVPTIDLLLDARATLAESLLWEPGEGVLYWVDIRAPALFRLDPATLENRRWELPEDVGAFALLDDGKSALVALRSGLFALSLATGSLGLVAKAPWDPQRYRFNEGACDHAGRFWVGCMFDPKPGHAADPAPGPLHCWTGAAGLMRQADEAKCHNGMGWSPDGATFYLSHSQERSIYAFPFTHEKGTVDAPRAFARTSGPGVPDGAAVDEEGAYWCAVNGAGRLHRYAPDGEKLRDVELPVSQPTMCAFGGPDLRTLFIASAAQHLDGEQREREPHAGGLFRLDPGVRGLPKATHAR